MSPLYENCVTLNDEQFRIIFGFEREGLDDAILIVSPVLYPRLIHPLFPDAKVFRTIWSHSVHVLLNGRPCIFFIPLPGAFHHLELLNFLNLPAGRILHFFGAVGLLQDNLVTDQLYGCGELFRLEISVSTMAHTVQSSHACLQPAGLPILRIISSHLVSLETPTAITQWQSQGMQSIDMEIAYLSDYLAVRDIKFYPVVWGTDYPHRGDTFH
nr:hypothetical protein [Candidatus Delongbacteria bacterium]